MDRIISTLRNLRATTGSEQHQRLTWPIPHRRRHSLRRRMLPNWCLHRGCLPHQNLRSHRQNLANQILQRTMIHKKIAHPQVELNMVQATENGSWLISTLDVRLEKESLVTSIWQERRSPDTSLRWKSFSRPKLVQPRWSIKYVGKLKFKRISGKAM